MLSTGMRRTFFGSAMAMLAVSIAAPRAAAESQPLQIAQTLGAEGTVGTVLRERSETRGTRTRSETRFDPVTGETTRERYEFRDAEGRTRTETRIHPVTGEMRVRSRTRYLDENGNVVRTRSEIRYDSDGNVIRERYRTRTDRSGSSRTARVERASRVERAERAERPERPSRPERAERPERSSRN